jgi:hypothetical protein
MRRDWNAPKPQHARYRIEYLPGKGHAVLDPSGRIAIDPTPVREVAQAACAHLQAEADRKAKRGPRPCLCCGTEFESEGIHNRMCARCRVRGDALGAYGYQGADAGRKPRRSAAGL